jgi:hypothetical protein
MGALAIKYNLPGHIHGQRYKANKNYYENEFILADEHQNPCLAAFSSKCMTRPWKVQYPPIN